MNSKEEKFPNFIIIGAAKAGTTSVYAYMKEHPQVFMTPIKETNYFAYEGKKTETFLGRRARNNFPITTIEEYTALFKDAKNESILGEASPSYLESPIAAERIKKLLPEAKLLAILRDPADRAFSAYMMALREGHQANWIVQSAFNEDEHYVQVGFYYDKLKRYFDLFPREQIKICLYHDLSPDTLSVVQDIFEYLGVDTSFEPDVASYYNVGGIPKSKALNKIMVKTRRNKTLRSIAPNWAISYYRAIYNKNLSKKIEFPQDLRGRLIDLYREDILKVQDLVQRDLTCWLSP